MKKVLLTFLIGIISYAGIAQNVGIGTNTPNASAVLDASSTTQGFLPPRMTFAQRNAIANPAAGLIVYCTDCANGEMQYYNGTGWINMSVGAGSVPFTTPIVSTNAITNISSSGAVSGGNITSNGGTSITARGICWSTNVNPTIDLITKTNDGTGTGIFTSTITGLTNNTTNYLRAYATNSMGTAYGAQQTFTTASALAVFPSVTICNKIWAVRNLDVATYRNGDPIPQVTDPTQWTNLTTGAWCWYNNDSATYGSTYGRLYNWYAVNDSRGLAPEGWHVPTFSEWNDLLGCLGGWSMTASTPSVAGVAMREAGEAHWIRYPYIYNTPATNSSGFTALPGGMCDGGFTGIGERTYWWCSNTDFGWWGAFFLLLDNNDYTVVSDWFPTSGFSVRCVRD